MYKVWLTLSMVVVAAYAAAPATSSTSTKREDPNNGSGNSQGGQPVYSPSASSNSYSSAAFDGQDAGNAYKAQQQSQGKVFFVRLNYRQSYFVQ